MNKTNYNFDNKKILKYVQNARKSVKYDIEPLVKLLISDYFPVKKEDLVIADLGGKAGFLAMEIAKRLPNCKVILVDDSAELLDYARQYAVERSIKLETVISDLHALDLPDNCVDVAISKGVLNSISDKYRFLAEGHRILRSAGTLITVELNAAYPFLKLVPSWIWYYISLGRDAANDLRQAHRISLTIREAADLHRSLDFAEVVALDWLQYYVIACIKGI